MSWHVCRALRCLTHTRDNAGPGSQAARWRSATSCALGEGSAPTIPRVEERLSARDVLGFGQNLQIVVDRHVSPGLMTTLGYVSLFGESGRCCVSRHRPSLCR